MPIMVVGFGWFGCNNKTAPPKVELVYVCFDNPLDIRNSFSDIPPIYRDTTNTDSICIFGESIYNIYINRKDSVFWETSLCKRLNELGIASELVFNDDESYYALETQNGSSRTFVVFSKESYLPIAYFTNHGRVKLLCEVYIDSKKVDYNFWMEAYRSRYMYDRYLRLQDDNLKKYMQGLED